MQCWGHLVDPKIAVRTCLLSQPYRVKGKMFGSWFNPTETLLTRRESSNNKITQYRPLFLGCFQPGNSCYQLAPISLAPVPWWDPAAFLLYMRVRGTTVSLLYQMLGGPASVVQLLQQLCFLNIHPHPLCWNHDWLVLNTFTRKKLA